MWLIGVGCLLVGIFGWWLETEKLIPHSFLSIIFLIGFVGLIILIFEAVFGRTK